MKFESFYDIHDIVYFINLNEQKIQEAKIEMIKPYAMIDSGIFNIENKGRILLGINYAILLENNTVLNNIAERLLYSNKDVAVSTLALWINKQIKL